MMARPGNINIGTSEHGHKGKCVRIEVRESGRRVLLVHMEHAEFGKALTGLAQCDCAIEYPREDTR